MRPTWGAARDAIEKIRVLGWWVVGSVQTGAWNVWLAYALVGLGLGLGIGGCVAATDGALRSALGPSRQMRRQVSV